MFSLQLRMKDTHLCEICFYFANVLHMNMSKEATANAAVGHCTLPLHRECSCPVATAGISMLWTELLCGAPSKQALTDVSLKWEGLFCHFIWRCTHNPCRLWGLDGGLFSCLLSTIVASIGIFLLGAVLQIVQVHLQAQLDCSCGGKTCMKNTSPKATSIKISLGLRKRDEIISLCLFPMEVSSMIPSQQRLQKSIAANAAAFYSPSIVINPRLQTHLDSFQCNKYFTWRIHVGNSSFLDVFISQQTKFCRKFQFFFFLQAFLQKFDI